MYNIMLCRLGRLSCATRASVVNGKVNIYTTPRPNRLFKFLLSFKRIGSVIIVDNEYRKNKKKTSLIDNT